MWEIIRVFKAATSYHIRRLEGKPWFAWQDDYYDSVIRTEAALQQIRQYILENPVRWSQDKLYRTSCIGGGNRREEDGADKSAMGTVNRPLRSSAYDWFIHP